ncbi:SAM-dependent methyltransferase [Ottowia thiooxydans]|uniref:SAM-dependent methyltransferase n=1 Tax=Ottowia thiooxydans TaxID=219182 RepID=UPI000414C53F|nr:methyltransferase domain-containing protein [Ottowia thiooxydans]
MNHPAESSNSLFARTELTPADQSRRRMLAIGGAALTASLLGAGPARAQKETPVFQPHSGQAGKDVVWVPTPDTLVTRMLQLGGVKSSDYVIDLGAGDGKIVIAAAKEFGARGLGIEYNPDMVALAQQRARTAGVSDRASFEKADIFQSDFSKADVITMYLLPMLNLRLRPTLMKLKPGTRLVTHAFDMGGWTADETSQSGGSTAYLWLVPANVGGTWQLSYPQGAGNVNVPFEVTRQRFQVPEGRVQLGEIQTSLRDARVIGDMVRFAFTGTDGVPRTFNGRVNGGKIEGEVFDGQRRQRFTAERKGDAPAIDVAE